MEGGGELSPSLRPRTCQASGVWLQPTLLGNAPNVTHRWRFLFFLAARLVFHSGALRERSSCIKKLKRNSSEDNGGERRVTGFTPARRRLLGERSKRTTVGPAATRRDQIFHLQPFEPRCPAPTSREVSASGPEREPIRAERSAVSG